MQNALQLTFRNVDPSDAVADRVRERVARLERIAPDIIACHVVVQAPQRHAQGNPYEVHIQLEMPGHEVVVSRDGRGDHAHEDVYVAVRDAFDAVERRLRDGRSRRPSGRRSVRFT